MKITIHTTDGQSHDYGYVEDIVYAKDGVNVAIDGRGDVDFFPYANIIKVVKR